MEEKIITISEIYKNAEKFANEKVKIAGWVRTVRDSKTFGFIELNDGSYFKNVQIIFEDKLNNFNDISHLALSSSIEVYGTLVLTPEAKQPFEIKAESIRNRWHFIFRLSTSKEKTFF